MQRSEVSGAVRPIYGSLGVKRLSCLVLMSSKTDLVTFIFCLIILFLINIYIYILLITKHNVITHPQTALYLILAYQFLLPSILRLHLYHTQSRTNSEIRKIKGYYLSRPIFVSHLSFIFVHPSHFEIKIPQRHAGEHLCYDNFRYTISTSSGVAASIFSAVI